jgi:hypothetical protein
MATGQGKSSEALFAAKLAAGTQKHLSKVGSLTVEGVSYTPAQIESQLNAFSTLRADVEAAKATVKAKLALERAQAPAMRAFIVAFVRILEGMFGNQPDVLADFGLSPKKARTPLTVEQKAAAKAKRAATREARGTKGKREKQTIKGDVTGVVVTPVTAASAHPAPQASGAAGAPTDGSASK